MGFDLYTAIFQNLLKIIQAFKIKLENYKIKDEKAEGKEEEGDDDIFSPTQMLDF